MPTKIEMTFSDVEFGTKEYGYIPRKRAKGVDDDDACLSEDSRYRKHLASQGVEARVFDGYVWLP